MAGEPTTHTIRMPKWGLSMQEGTITHWHVKPGDSVEAGAPFCDIETTKITNEFEAPQSGVVQRLLVGSDEVVAVGRPIAILAGPDAIPAEIDAAVAAAEAPGEAQAGPLAAGPVLRYAGTGTSRLAYVEAGDPSSANAVIFLHGFGGDHAGWAATQDALAVAGYRTVALDLPGHGASTKAVGDGTAAMLAQTVRAGIEGLGLKRITLVAHSFGALVAARLVKDGGLDPDAVILIAPLGFGVAPSPAFIRGYLGAERRRDMKVAMEMLFAKPSLLGRGIVSDALATLRDEDAREALNRIGARLLDPDPKDLGLWLDLLEPNVHLIWGNRDAVVPLDATVSGAIGEQLHVVEEAGHLPHVEKPAVVDNLILRLLRS